MKWTMVLVSVFIHGFCIGQLKQDSVTNKLVEVGDTPQFAIPDFSGRTINLSDFKGKYILLDFWASWCAPCRKLNPGLVKLYNEYKSPKFDIIGVSIDTDRSAWYRAIKNDGLPWLHLSDLAGEAGKAADYVAFYMDGKKGVAVPQNYLIDPNGKVIAKNLHGEELEDMLKKTLNAQ